MLADYRFFSVFSNRFRNFQGGKKKLCAKGHPSPFRNGRETGVQIDRKTDRHFRNNNSRVIVEHIFMLSKLLRNSDIIIVIVC